MAKARKHPENNLKAWRVFRGLTQEQLGEMVGTEGSVIANLENGDRGLSNKWLIRIAPALKISPGTLMDHTPEAVPSSVFDIWMDIPDENKEQAAQILRTFTKSGTRG